MSYASVASLMPSANNDSTLVSGGCNKKEESYNEARRALRLWRLGWTFRLPEKKLHLSAEFLASLEGHVEMKRPREVRRRQADEYIVFFETIR